MNLAEFAESTATDVKSTNPEIHYHPFPDLVSFPFVVMIKD